MRNNHDSDWLLLLSCSRSAGLKNKAPLTRLSELLQEVCVFNFKCQAAVSGAALGICENVPLLAPLISLPSVVNEVAKDGANGIDFPFVIARH